jgi:hypothetical protein
VMPIQMGRRSQERRSRVRAARVIRQSITSELRDSRRAANLRATGQSGYGRSDRTRAIVAAVNVATQGERRPDRADLAAAAIAASAFLGILWLGRGMTFFADEWAIIVERPISVDNFLRPFNEHWLGVTEVVYRILLEQVGLTSYVPYLVLLLVLHVVVIFEIYVLVRRSAGALLGLLGASIFAVLGSGFENLYWAMQIGFVGAIALGLGAVLLLDEGAGRGRSVAAAILLTIGVMTSGFGILMLAFAGLDLLFDPGRRHRIIALLLPGGVYLAWYMAFGKAGLATYRDPFTVGALKDVPAFVADGVGTAIGSALGLGPILGRLAGAGLAIAICWRLIRYGFASVPPRALACFSAIVVQYGILGTIRAQVTDNAAEYSRYTYLSAIFALLGFAVLIGHRSLTGPGRFRLARLGSLTAIATLALTWNLWLLIAGRSLFLDRADSVRASITVAMGDLGPGVDPDRAILMDRKVTQLREAIAQFGSPLHDALAEDAVRPVPLALVASIRERLAAESAVP